MRMSEKLIDLTQTLGKTTSIYPDTVGPKFEWINTVEKDGFAELKIEMVLHSGTHIDAPCHILQNTKSIDQFPIQKFIGPAIVIPCGNEQDISLPFLKSFETKIAQVEFILFFTGWQFKWNSPAYLEDCPILTREAAEWLCTFPLKGIGLDAFSVDKVVSAQKVSPENLPNHHLLLGKEFILIENLTNLDQLPAEPFLFQCLPLRIEDADGSPVRAIATLRS